MGAVNVLSTLVAVFGVDRFGRRALLLEAGFQMFVAEVIIAVLLGGWDAGFCCCWRQAYQMSVAEVIIAVLLGGWD